MKPSSSIRVDIIDAVATYASPVGLSMQEYSAQFIVCLVPFRLWWALIISPDTNVNNNGERRRMPRDLGSDILTDSATPSK